MRKIEWENTTFEGLCENLKRKPRDHKRGIYIGDGYEPYAAWLPASMSAEKAVEKFITTYTFLDEMDMGEEGHDEDFFDRETAEEELRERITYQEYEYIDGEWEEK